MRNILLWGAIPMLYLLIQSARIGSVHYTANIDCDSLKGDRQSFIVCSRKKRVAQRNMKRFWDGY